jgi:hypothetical protein
LFYLGKELKETDENGKQIYLSDYRLRNEGNIFLVLRLNGWTDAIATAVMDALKSNEPVISDFDDHILLSDAEDAQSLVPVTTGHSPNPTLKVLGPEIELTSESDMITFDDDKENQRSMMPCGHAIGIDEQWFKNRSNQARESCRKRKFEDTKGVIRSRKP